MAVVGQINEPGNDPDPAMTLDMAFENAGILGGSYIDVKLPKKTWPLHRRRGLGCKQRQPVLLSLEGCEVTQTGYGLHVLECLQSVVRIAGVVHGQTHLDPEILWDPLIGALSTLYFLDS